MPTKQHHGAEDPMSQNVAGYQEYVGHIPKPTRLLPDDGMQQLDFWCREQEAEWARRAKQAQEEREEAERVEIFWKAEVDRLAQAMGRETPRTSRYPCRHR